MSTHEDRLAEHRKAARARARSLQFGPLEAAAISAAHLHGAVVLLVVLAGLGGLRPEFLPAVTAGWTATSTAWTALIAISSMIAAATPDQRIMSA